MKRSLETNIARLVLKSKVIALRPSKPFTWASGIRSPIYCDSRLLISDPKALRVIIQSFKKLIRNEKLRFDVIAGIATAGIPYAAILADHFKKPLVYVRSKPKDHGKGNQVEGRFKKGQMVLVIEDLVSTGQSSLAAIEAVQKEGGQVSHCLAIFTYGFPETLKAFQEARCQLITLTNLQTLLEEANKSNKISKSEVQLIEEFSKDPYYYQINDEILLKP